MSRSWAAPAASAGSAIALAAVAFGAGGGTQTGRVAPVEVAVVLIVGLLLARALLTHDLERRVYGGGALALFALLTVLTGLSMAWSVAPDLSLQELARTFTYLAVFALAVVAAHHLPRGGGRLLGAILMAAIAVCAWALATRVWPSALGGDVLGARLGEPFDYWNALGGMAALAVPGALWLGSRRAASPVTAALAYPALGALLLTILLTQSRGALAAAIIAVLGWLAFVPLRLRTAPVVIVPAIAVAPVAAWALSKDAFTAVLQPLSAREAVAGDFGLLLLVSLGGLLVAGAVAVRIRSRATASLEVRWRAGIALLAVLCVLAAAGAAGAATSGGGIGGRLGDLTADTNSAPGSGAGRLGSTSSSRGEYWRQAFHVFEDAPLLGRGADGFTLARLPYRTDPRAAGHAHGFLPQTLADLGLVGVLLALSLLGAWLWAAARTLGFRRGPAPRPDWGSERVALAGLTLCAVAYGLQSAIDWTWFVPGPTVAALAAAGFVAGRGPLPAVGALSVDADDPAIDVAGGPGRRARGIAGAGPLRAIGATALVITAALCAWAVWQPQRAASATDRAMALVDDHPRQAVAQADRARDIDPYSPDPLYVRATALASMGDRVAAYRSLEQAVAEHPRDPETWLRMGEFELTDLDLPARALDSANAAYAIDPKSVRVNTLANAARNAIAASAPPAKPGNPAAPVPPEAESPAP